MNVLAEVIKSHDVNLYKIAAYNKCTLLKSTYAQYPFLKYLQEKGFKY